MDLEKVIYYLNQGGPALQGAIVYGLYYAYQLAKTLLTELQTTNDLLGKQNELLAKLVANQK